jgi:peptidoglycan/LPS O-acetylase OafA/YrhL
MNKDFSYRSDIDGLRAIAVLIVVFFMQILAGYPAVMWELMYFFYYLRLLITTTIERNSSK